MFLKVMLVKFAENESALTKELVYIPYWALVMYRERLSLTVL